MAYNLQLTYNLQFINVDSIYSNLGKKFCKALPAYYAFMGSDFTIASSMVDLHPPPL